VSELAITWASRTSKFVHFPLLAKPANAALVKALYPGYGTVGGKQRTGSFCLLFSQVWVIEV